MSTLSYLAADCFTRTTSAPPSKELVTKLKVGGTAWFGCLPAGLDDPYALFDNAYKEAKFAHMPKEFDTERGIQANGDKGTSYGSYGLTHDEWQKCFEAVDVQVQYVKDEVLFPDTDVNLANGEPQWLVMNKLKYNLLVTRVT